MEIKRITQMSDEKLKVIADLLKAIAHPIRLRILCLLCKESKNVGEMEEILKKEQAVVSQQLKILRLNNLVTVQRENGFSIYSIALDKCENLKNILKSICQLTK